MSNDALKPDIYILQQSVVDVLSQVRDLMNYASQKLETPDSKDRRYADHSKSIENEITKVKNLELRMAIAAPMKAGKSTIINAIVGQDILPSRNAAMTTLPTEIVFSKEVTEPKLMLRYQDADTYDVLKRSWGSLKRKIQQIGLPQAKQDIFAYPHLQDLLEEIAGNPEISFIPEVLGTEAIQDALTKINDLVRLCSVLVPSENPLTSLMSVPRIEVPFLQTQSSLKLDGIGKLVFVDTPGPNEAGDLKLEDVVKRQLQFSSIILLVLDYTQLNADAAEKVKRDVDEVTLIKGRESIYILVNKIDLRKKKEDMTKEQVLEFVSNKFGIEASTDRVFEISASRAAYASNFRSELNLKPNVRDPQLMETAELLARQAFGDMWEDEFPEATIERMIKASDRIWSKSGFADFLEKAIGALMSQAAPLTLFNALNDVRSRLTALQNSINLQKNAFGQDIQKLQGQIAELERDLTILIDCQNKLKIQVSKLGKKLEEELSDNLQDMQEQSREELKRIFGRREFNQAGLVKKFGLGLTRMAGLLVGLNYQGTGTIEFKSLAEANKFVESATASARSIVNDLMSNARENALRRVQKSRKGIEDLLKRETKPIIEQAQKRLKDQFKVNLQLPDMFDDVDLEENLDLGIRAKSDSRSFTEYEIVKERRWYTLWCWEHEKKVPVSKTERFYSVSIDEITNTVDQSIEGAVDKVKSQIFAYLKEDFQSVLDNFFDELDRFLKGYKEDLQRSIEAGKRSAEDQKVLKTAFDEISAKSSKLTDEVDKQKGYINNLLPNKK
jgi:signal recognition particle receptor subunit beta